MSGATRHDIPGFFMIWPSGQARVMVFAAATMSAETARNGRTSRIGSRYAIFECYSRIGSVVLRIPLIMSAAAGKSGDGSRLPGAQG
jgi:hypothetical protein